MSDVKRDVLEVYSEQRHQEEITLHQARLLEDIFQMPGWDVLCGRILGQKFNAERKRRQTKSNMTNEKLALYYNGMVDGVEDTISFVMEIKQEARNILAQYEEPKEAPNA